MLFEDKPLEDREYPDEDDLVDEDDPSTRLVRCGNCGEMIHELAPQCPHCREWIIAGQSDWRSSRKWYVRGGLHLAKTLLWNWLFWLALAALAAAAAIIKILD